MTSSDAPARAAAPRAAARFAWLDALDPVALALRLTLLTLLLRPVGTPALRVGILALAALGLAVPAWLRRPPLWIALAALTAVRVAMDWSVADNHAYLLAYWCLAVALALVARDPAACLALNARGLVACAFAFAVLWKLVLSPDYLDGRFFRVTLLTDDRFADVTRLAAGLDPATFAALRAFVRGEAGDADGPTTLPDAVLALARFATSWTIAVEAAVALAWSWPVAGGPARARDAILIFFCLTTYAIATVAGFGWLLLAMGIAQCDPRRRAIRLAYLAAFGAVLAYDGLAPVPRLAERLAPVS